MEMQDTAMRQAIHALKEPIENVRVEGKLHGLSIRIRTHSTSFCEHKLATQEVKVPPVHRKIWFKIPGFDEKNRAGVAGKFRWL